MQGTSTKITAGAFATSIVLCVSYVLFTAPWGPGWVSPPAEVVVAFTGIVGSLVAWWVPEKALISS